MRKTAEQVSEGHDLSGRIAIVTGGNSGIGKETVRVLVKRKCLVVMACRSGEDAKQEILKEMPENKHLLDVMHLDLSSLDSVQNFAQNFLKKYSSLHFLINNAGVTHQAPQKTKDGFDAVFGVNHLGHFYLTMLLLPLLEKSAPSRVINVSSDAHRFVDELDISTFDPKEVERRREERRKKGEEPENEGENYHPQLNYGASKLLNILFSNELTRRKGEKGVHSFSLHPGIIHTNFTRELGKEEGKKAVEKFATLAGVKEMSIPEGAATTLHACLVPLSSLPPLPPGLGSHYFSECAYVKPSRMARDPELAKAVWDLSLRLLAPRLSKL